MHALEDFGIMDTDELARILQYSEERLAKRREKDQQAEDSKKELLLFLSLRPGTIRPQLEKP